MDLAPKTGPDARTLRTPGMVRIEENPRRNSTSSSSKSHHSPATTTHSRPSPMVDVPLHQADEKQRGSSRTPRQRVSRRSFVPLTALVSAIGGIPLLAKALSDLPRVYKRIWWFHKQQDREWTAGTLTDPSIRNDGLYYMLVTLVALMGVSAIWNALSFFSRVSRRTRNIHPGMQIAVNLVLCIFLAESVYWALKMAEDDMNPHRESSRYWLSNVRAVYYAGPHKVTRPRQRVFSNLSWRWRGQPKLHHKGSRYYLVMTGCACAAGLATFHLLMFVVACFELHARRQQQRQELKDHIAEHGSGRVTDGRQREAEADERSRRVRKASSSNGLTEGARA